MSAHLLDAQEENAFFSEKEGSSSSGASFGLMKSDNYELRCTYVVIGGVTNDFDASTLPP